MRFIFLAGCFAGVACSAPTPGTDGGTDAGLDPLDDAGTDAGTDAGHDAGPAPYTGCTCGDAGVCGTGGLGDPLRCCNYLTDSCTQDAGPCAPLTRCSPKPPCCATNSCFSTVSCGGSGACLSWLGGGAVPDGTPCDDGRTCSEATPPVTLQACGGLDAGEDGDDCRTDSVAAFPSASACPRDLPSCSGRGSAYGGNGGAITGGRCCPQGTACDQRLGSPTRNKCLGNLGRGSSTSNDVCRAGVCATDVTATCP